ncbi:major vault protein alpha-like [Anneissia japonica]|uniref:major vault protein alpha-like n=1 Tax=Anneissia japonica TaxID=1529436 RepID=UPI0014259106|nr:major vault protein alpha-like [Anneissia japonica]
MSAYVYVVREINNYTSQEMERFRGGSASINGQIIGIGPTEFVHILNLSTNITFLETGPQRLILQSNEKLVAGPLSCIIVPPAYYCTVKNPIKNLEEGKQCELEHGHFDVRFHQVVTIQKRYALSQLLSVIKPLGSKSSWIIRTGMFSIRLVIAFNLMVH